MDAENQAILDTLRAQRNVALDTIAEQNAAIARLNQQLAKLNEQLAKLNEQPAKPQRKTRAKEPRIGALE